VNKQILDNLSNKFVKADENCESIILNWAEKFILEATPEDKDKLQGSLERVKNNLRDGEIFLLLHEDKPVSMVRMAGETVNGRLINLVYTPPEFRKKGYATEVVACLSQYILDLGYDFCLLFTDLSNSTSNKIYMNIGYKPIIDIDMYRFTDK
jgi:predicted GNAT family acetyltransferase